MRPLRRLASFLSFIAVLSVAACSTPRPIAPVVEEAPPVVVPVIEAEKGGEELVRVLVLLQEKNYAQAEVNLQEIVRVRPDLPEAHFNLAWVKQRLNKHSEVAEHVANGLKLKPNEVSALLLQALSERELGKFPDAEASYLKAEGLAPNDDRVQLNLGILYDLYMLRSHEALEHYRRYQKLKPAPDPKVGGWIAALERTLGVKSAAEAKEDSAVTDAKAPADATVTTDAMPTADATVATDAKPVADAKVPTDAKASTDAKAPTAAKASKSSAKPRRKSK